MDLVLLCSSRGDSVLGVSVTPDLMNAACSALANWHYYESDYVFEADAIRSIFSALHEESASTTRRARHPHKKPTAGRKQS